MQTLELPCSLTLLGFAWLWQSIIKKDISIMWSLLVMISVSSFCVCFGGAISVIEMGPFGTGTDLPILLDNIACTGNEASLHVAMLVGEYIIILCFLFLFQRGDKCHRNWSVWYWH